MLTINIAGHGCSPKLEKFVNKYLEDLEARYVYSVESLNVSNRHCHWCCGPVPKNLKSSLVGKIMRSKQFPELTKDNANKAIICRTLYVDGNLVDPNSNIKSGLDYISKEPDQVLHYSPGFTTWEDFQQFLQPHKTLEERRQVKAWAQMDYYQKLLIEHELPTTTVDDICVSLTTLAYVKKVCALPRDSERPGLARDLHRYINSMSVHMVDDIDTHAFHRKRKREKEESEYYREVLYEKLAVAAENQPPLQTSSLPYPLGKHN